MWDRDFITEFLVIIIRTRSLDDDLNQISGTVGAVTEETEALGGEVNIAHDQNMAEARFQARS